MSERVLLFIRRKNKEGGNRNEWLKIDYFGGPGIFVERNRAIEIRSGVIVFSWLFLALLKHC
jgi:hypothetical protein